MKNNPKGSLYSSLHHLQELLHVSVPELSLAGTLKLIDEQSAAASTTFWILMEEHECLL